MQYQFSEIGIFHCRERWPYEAARQGVLGAANTGEVRLRRGRNFSQALIELTGFSHVWLLYVFHQNTAWKPLVRPPRGTRKIGVFASRAPYRPNPIGLSCVELVAIKGLNLLVRNHDLLDGTPILDIKPYLPYADAVPAARTGWVEQVAVETPDWEVGFSVEADAQLRWLEAEGGVCMAAFLRQQLGTAPLDATRKRLQRLADGSWQIAYRTWRADFTANADSLHIGVLRVYSGYSPAALASAADKYGDKERHRAFLCRWPATTRLYRAP